MIFKLIKNDWLQWKRESRLKGLFLFVVFISFLALWHQLNYQVGLSETRLKAGKESRQEWLSQELKHPHMAAHFGNYAYKVPSVLHCFDPGLSIYTGTSVYLEPHRQNDFLFSKVQESSSGTRFGWLSPALVCQLIIPLLILLFLFNAINGEKSRGTLVLMLSQGATMKKIMLAKTMSAFLIFELFFTFYFLLTACAASLLFDAAFDGWAVLYVWASYSFYFLCWSLLAVFISKKISNAGGAIAVLLLIWVFSNVIIPRIAVNVAENLYPVISNYQFRKDIKEAEDKGLDGHNPSDERAKKIEREMLAKYKVDSVQQLPFNFEGFIMQQSEEYTSQVYDYYFGQIYQSLKNQKKAETWFAALSPFIVLRNMSMAGCNSHLESQIDFQQQAEHYRRSFVQNLNNDMKDNSAYGSFFTYRVDKNKYSEIKDLGIQNKPLAQTIFAVLWESAMLLLWAMALLIVVLQTAKQPLYT